MVTEMSTSRRIRELLEQGYTPSEIVRMGYAKSTVYITYRKWLKEKLEALQALPRLLNMLLELIICAPSSENALICIHGSKKMSVKLTKVNDETYVITVKQYEES